MLMGNIPALFAMGLTLLKMELKKVFNVTYVVIAVNLLVTKLLRLRVILKNHRNYGFNI